MRARVLIGAVVCAVLLGFFCWDCLISADGPRVRASGGDGADAPAARADNEPVGESVREPERRPAAPSGVVDGSPAARLVFLCTRDIRALADLPVRLQGEGARTLSKTTDAQGAIAVPPGRWMLSLPTEGYELARAEVDLVAEQQEVLWVSPVGPLTIRIRDAAGAPIAGVCVAIMGERARYRPEYAQSGDDGLARLEGVVLDGEQWLIASKAGWQPAQCQLAALPVVAGCVELVLAPDAGRRVVLACRDDQGGPLPGVRVRLRPQQFGDRDIWVGDSSADGTVEVGSLLTLVPCEFWFDGPVYTTRLSVEKEPAEAVIPVRLPQPVRGELLLDGASGSRKVFVSVVDVGRTGPPGAGWAKQYVNAMGRSMDVVGGRIALDLPGHRAVVVKCRDQTGRIAQATFTATDPGWQLALALGHAEPSHQITIIPRGGAIDSVRLRQHPVELFRSGDVVSFRAPAGFVGFEAYAQSGRVGLALSGRLDGDVLLDVPMPRAHRLQFVVRDQQGEPVPEVQVEFRRTSPLSRDLVPGTSFKMFQIPNIMECEADARGSGSAELVAGTYEAWVRNASFRDHLGAWRPLSGATFEVPWNGPLRIVTTRPRRVTVRLAADLQQPGQRWHLWGDAGRILGAFQSSSGCIWCSDDAHVLAARSEGGAVLGEVRIPAGVGDCEVEVVAPNSRNR